MRIAIDSRTSGTPTGVGQYGTNLIDALTRNGGENEYVILRAPARSFPFITAHLTMRRRYRGAHADLVHVLGGTPPLGYRKPYVLTVHDLAIYRHPEWFPEGQWFSKKISYPMTIKNAAHIIVPSEVTKKDLIELFKVSTEKITVVPHGVKALTLPSPVSGEVLESHQSLPKREGDRDGSRYILFLGTIEPRKNLQTLIEVYRNFVDQNPVLKDVELRIAGGLGWKYDEIISDIDRARVQGYQVHHLSSVSEEEKWKLLQEAACLVMPSHYEGFGLPILEAMEAGCPVLCSDIPVFHEVAGDAALFSDFTSDPAGSLVKQLCTDKKIADELRVKGLARAAQFSWERTARETIGVYRRVIALRGAPLPTVQ